jgi:apyrase
MIYGNVYEHVDDRSRKRAAPDSKRTSSVKKFAACATVLGVVLAWRVFFAPGSAKSSEGDEAYSVVFDAGSTGSRVHVFRFSPTLDLLKISEGELSFFAQVKPGLSSYKDNPVSAQDGIGGLMEKAMTVIPKGITVPVAVGATAGLRLLDEEKQSSLLNNVELALKKYPVTVDSVRILNPSEEAAFQWGSAFAGGLGSIVVVDLGGGSMQIAYEPASGSAAGFAYSTPAGSVNLNVQSFLGQGLMASRARFLRTETACIAQGKEVSFDFGGSTYRGTGSGCGGCLEAAERAVLGCPIGSDKCNAIQIGQPKKNPAADVILTSYYVDRAGDAGYADEDTWGDTSLYSKAALEVCAQESPHDEWLALDLALMSAQLKQLGISGRARLVKRLTIGGHKVEMAWPLGMALHAVSKSKAESKR